MMIECNIVVLLLQGLLFKIKKIRELSLSHVPSVVRLCKELCDLGASINLMPLSIYKKLGLGDPKPTAMRLLMVDRILKKPIEILHDVLVKVDFFIFMANFCHS